MRPHALGPGGMRNARMQWCTLRQVRVLRQVVEPLLRRIAVVVIAHAEAQAAPERPLGPDLQGLVVAVEAGNIPFGKAAVLWIRSEELAFRNCLLVAQAAGKRVRCQVIEERVGNTLIDLALESV